MGFLAIMLGIGLIIRIYRDEPKPSPQNKLYEWFIHEWRGHLAQLEGAREQLQSIQVPVEDEWSTQYQRATITRFDQDIARIETRISFLKGMMRSC